MSTTDGIVWLRTGNSRHGVNRIRRGRWVYWYRHWRRGCCFPLSAPGLAGLSPILLMLVLTPHCVLACTGRWRVCVYQDHNPSGNNTETVEEHFGKTGGVVIVPLLLCDLSAAVDLWRHHH